MSLSNDKIVKLCEEAKEKMISLGIEEQLVSEIEWCLGSFASDGNPSGLIEKSAEAVAKLEAFKVKNPRKVGQKLIDDLKKISA